MRVLYQVQFGKKKSSWSFNGEKSLSSSMNTVYFIILTNQINLNICKVFEIFFEYKFTIILTWWNLQLKVSCKILQTWAIQTLQFDKLQIRIYWFSRFFIVQILFHQLTRLHLKHGQLPKTFWRLRVTKSSSSLELRKGSFGGLRLKL